MTVATAFKVGRGGRAGVGLTLALTLAACTGVVSGPPGSAPTGNPSTGSGGPGSGATTGTATGTGATTGTGTAGMGGVVPTGAGGAGSATCTAAPASTPSFHRLNTKQYQESVNQILGINLPLRADLPPDSSLFGFDNGADTTITAALSQRYLDAAKKAVAAALTTPAARTKLVPCNLAQTGAAGVACVRTVLTAWLPKAFRRPVLTTEVDAYVAYTTTCASSAEAGLSCALQAALMSPKFLFRDELLSTDPAAATCTEAKPLASTNDGILGQYALAARLSYFLWNAPPDDTLYAAAAAGTLAQPATLAAQVDRMLAATAQSAHPFAFAQDFPQQYLPLTALETVQPSPTLFPTFDAPLRQAMHDESQLFFQDVLLNNGSVLDLLRSDYTFLNDRLAKHYGIAGVTGTNMRKVSTTGTLRGGVPTQGSFLTATSSTENTSLVLRAKWVLTNLLCVSIPPPPPKAVIDAVPVPDPGLGLTNRESLDIRTAGEPCHSCHLNINPIGYGLEAFDPVGAVRTTQNGKTIDTSGVLPGGKTFANTSEMLDLLRQDDRFASCVTKKMMTYALGRGMVASCDDAVVNDLANQLKADGYKLRNHIVRIVQSPMFRSPRVRTEVMP